MGIAMWMNLALFFLLFSMMVYMFVSVTITDLHKVYFAFHFFLMLWPICQVAIQTTESPKLQLFYFDVAFVSVALLGAGWLAFTIFLIGRSDMLRRNIFATMLIPALMAALGVIFNPYGLFVRPLHGGFIKHTYGPLFWCIIIIVMGYLFVSFHLMIKTMQTANLLRVKRQVRLVLTGTSLLIFCVLSDILLNIVLAAWLPDIPGLTSLGLLLSDIFFIIAICRYNAFDILTIAHQDVIDTIAQGILVLDENETVIEINRSLRPQIDCRLGDRFNMETFVTQFCTDSDMNLFLQTYRRHPLKKVEIEITHGENDRLHTIIQAAPIMVHGVMKGRIISFQDVSELRRLVEKTKQQIILLHERNQSLLAIRDELFEANRKLEQQAITDSLTGCYNRHYLTQQLEREVIENVRSRTPFSIILLDIDFFKQINDRYGHLTGDDVICDTVNTIMRNLRKNDILARFGGEEFMIYLPNSDQSQANILAERVRAAVESNKIAVKNEALGISVTISAGVLTIDHFIDEVLDKPDAYLSGLLALVDAALYQAKKEGRNRVVRRTYNSNIHTLGDRYNNIYKIGSLFQLE